MEFDNRTCLYKMCRVCLTLCENWMSISSSNIVNMLTTCTSVQIWVDDELPNQICGKCFLQLQNLFNFKQLVETSDMQLRKSLKVDKQNSNETRAAVYIKVEHEDNINDDCDHTNTLKCKTENLFDENNAPVIKATKNVKVKMEEHSSANDTSLTDHKTTSEFKAEFLLDETDELEDDESISNLKESNRTINKIKSKSDNSRSTRVSCEICKKLVTREYFKTHIKTHNKQFNCSYCNKVLANQSLLDTHLREFHNAEYILSQTSAENPDKTTDQLNQPDPVHLEESNISNNLAENSHLNKAPSNNATTTGEIPDDREPCEVCGKLIVKRNRACHMQIHSDKRRVFQCTECDKSFLSKHYMNYHFEAVHKKMYRFECTICGKKFHNKCYFERHEAVHRNENSFHCTYCEKRFNYKKALMVHVRSVHFKLYKKKSTDRKPCTVCGKLISEQNMSLHTKIHKTERPIFECPLCPDKKFLYKVSLDSHTKFKHENVVPEHLCTVCGRRKKTSSALKAHMNTHNSEKSITCKVCELKFKGHSSLWYHMRSAHLKLKPHTCEVCSRSFLTDMMLKRHLLIHTGERPFMCSLCQKSFTQKSTLVTHKKLVHLAEKRSKKVPGDSLVLSDGSSWSAQ